MGKIRVLALGIIRDGDRLFVGKGYDSISKTTFYRVLGGGVEFGETSLAALQREFQEEIQAELTNIEYVACLESIFTLEEKSKHEIIQLYRCDFADRKFYQLDEVDYTEGKRSKKAYWIERQRFESGELRLVPEDFLQYC
ncbi:MAG: NUDIX domain-containing protein [Cyanobacteriota bacterium]|nr:NUDIX domain-containing protein [Cyanobacteriota bacterium]